MVQTNIINLHMLLFNTPKHPKGNTMIITLLLLPALVIAAGLIELAVMLKAVQIQEHYEGIK